MNWRDRVFVFAGVGAVIFLVLSQEFSAASILASAVIAALFVIAVEGAASE